MIGCKRKGEFVGRKDETFVKNSKVFCKKPTEGYKKSGAVEKRLGTNKIVNNKPEDRKMANKQRPINQGDKSAFVYKKKPWFMLKHFKNTENGKAEQGRKEEEEGKSLPVIKTVATYSKSNFSSNWKTLAQALHLNEGTKKPVLPHKPKEKKSSKRVKRKIAKDRSQSVVTEPQTSHQLDVWFDDVDEELLKINEGHSMPPLPRAVAVPSAPTSSNDRALAKPGSFSGATKTVAMDCEMVGVGDGGKDSILARVSIVNRMGHTVFDKFVKPREKVTDYRTHVSGVRPPDLENAEDFATVQKEVYEIINGRILVGHAIYNDLKVLFLSHPKSKIRDTSKYKPFRKLFDGRNPSLKKLTEKLVGVAVQTGEHNSVQDAQAAMRLYTMHRKDWEREIKTKKFPKTKKQESVVK